MKRLLNKIKQWFLKGGESKLQQFNDSLTIEEKEKDFYDRRDRYTEFLNT